MQVLDYFKQNFGINNLGEIYWSHAVNSKGKLSRFLNDGKTHFIESDIRVNPAGVAVAVHPPELESDLTFEQLVNSMKNSKQGLKIDFKDPEILILSLEYLKDADLKQPVLLNADVLQGNGANPSKFSAYGFMALCQKIYPRGIFSVGWTTIANPDFPYTEQNIDDMLNFVINFEEVTFPVRACLLPNSWSQLQRLLSQKEGYTLSIWNNEPVEKELQDWIRDNTDTNKCFYDFIDENKDPLRFW